MSADRRFALLGHTHGTGSGGAIQLTDLSDVTSAAVTSGFALLADGSNYVGRALVEADITDLGSYLPLAGGAVSGNITGIPELHGSANYVNLGSEDSGTAQPFMGYNVDAASSVVSNLLTGAVAGVLFQNNGNVKLYSEGSAAAGTTASPAVTVNSSQVLFGDRGLSLGSQVAATTVDNSKHLALYSTNYGLNITGGTINLVAAGANIHQFTNTYSKVRGTLRVQNTNNTDFVDFSHDGTDFNIAGTLTTDINITGAALRIGGNVGFYNTAPVAQPTSVAVTAAGIHAALVTLGLIT